MALDTLSISKELRAAGFSEEQADAIATQIAARPDDLVTRQDLAIAVAELERKIDQIEPRLLFEARRGHGGGVQPGTDRDGYLGCRVAEPVGVAGSLDAR